MKNEILKKHYAWLSTYLQLRVVINHFTIGSFGHQKIIYTSSEIKQFQMKDNNNDLSLCSMLWIDLKYFFKRQSLHIFSTNLCNFRYFIFPGTVSSERLKKGTCNAIVCKEVNKILKWKINGSFDFPSYWVFKTLCLWHYSIQSKSYTVNLICHFIRFLERRANWNVM